MVFELGNEILIIYQTFWNNLSVVTKMGMFAMFVVKIFKIEEHLQAILKLMKTENILGPHHHLPCNCQDWQGLFFQSEEVVEATHLKFETFWKQYKVLDVESEQHGQSLLECLLDFNTKNI